MKTVYEFKGERQADREYQADIGDDRWIGIRRRKKQHYLVIADSRALICLRFVQIGSYSDACCGQIVRLQHVVLPVEGGVCGPRANETRPIPLPQSRRVNTTSLHRSLLERVRRVLAKCTNECRCARFAQALPVQRQSGF